MAQPRLKKWTAEEFFTWQEKQEARFELVDGFPIRMMTGARNVHNDIVINVLAELRNQLRTSSCYPFSGDCSVQTRADQIRRPDIGVECGPRDPNAYLAKNPCVIAEVLSPSTRDFETLEKMNEYKGLASLEHILLIEPNLPEIILWSRKEDGSWGSQTYDRLDETVELPNILVKLPLRDIYDRVAFPARPNLTLLPKD